MSSLREKRVVPLHPGRFGCLGLALCVMGAVTSCGDSDSGGNHGAGGSTPKSDGGAPDGTPTTDAAGSRDGEGTTPDGGEARDGARSDGGTTADGAIRDTPSTDEGMRPDGSGVPDGVAPPPMDVGTMADVATPPDVTTVPDGGTSSPTGAPTPRRRPSMRRSTRAARQRLTPGRRCRRCGHAGHFQAVRPDPAVRHLRDDDAELHAAGRRADVELRDGVRDEAHRDATRRRSASDLAARITYHAQCDNYDRLGGLFFVVAAQGQMPATTDPRIELVALHHAVQRLHAAARSRPTSFPHADISTFARTLADPTQTSGSGSPAGRIRTTAIRAPPVRLRPRISRPSASSIRSTSCRRSRWRPARAPSSPPSTTCQSHEHRRSRGRSPTPGASLHRSRHGDRQRPRRGGGWRRVHEHAGHRDVERDADRLVQHEGRLRAVRAVQPRWQSRDLPQQQHEQSAQLVSR